jgi:hypothetical protein
MISAIKFQYTSDAFKEQISYLETIDDTMEEMALAAAVKLEDALDSIYATAPARGDNPFIWSLDPAAQARARGWWFANLRKGKIPTDGKHYARHGKPPYGAAVDIEHDSGGRVIISFVQKWKKSSYVFGTMREDTRVIGHKATGWNFADEELQKVLEEIQLELLQKIAAGFTR